MTDDLPQRVRTAADTSRFGPLVARVAHPNGRVYLVAYGLWALLAALNPMMVVVSAVFGWLVEEGSHPAGARSSCSAGGRPRWPRTSVSWRSAA